MFKFKTDKVKLGNIYIMRLEFFNGLRQLSISGLKRRETLGSED